MLVNWC